MSKSSPLLYASVVIGCALGLLCTVSSAAQAEMTMPDMPSMPGMSGSMMPSPRPSATASATTKVVPATPAPSGGMEMHTHMSATMPAVTNLTDPMSREGSGTSWMPDSSQVFGYMQTHKNGAMSMEHFAASPRYVDDGSQRGNRRLDAPNWFMGMESLPIGKNAQLGLRAMTSFDFLTENGSGYPLLFQTGETWHGQPLHDAQHPHDLFSELSGTLSTRIGSTSSAYVYLGYPGEPALGPPTFMHRRIAYDMADAPIGHHWQDATHVAFGVATVGVTHRNVKVEGSTFTGREPNEIRTNFDPIHLDSYSTRLSWNAGRNLAAQVSQGYVHSPEALAPGTDVHRSTASVLYDHALRPGKNVYAALTFGQNNESDKTRTNSYLAEFDYQADRNTYFGRLERIGKTGAELVIPLPGQVFELTQGTLGYVKDLSRSSTGMQTGIGAQASLGFKPASLNPYYGSGAPVSFEVFFRLRPPELTPSNMPSMNMTAVNSR